MLISQLDIAQARHQLHYITLLSLLEQNRGGTASSSTHYVLHLATDNCVVTELLLKTAGKELVGRTTRGPYGK